MAANEERFSVYNMNEEEMRQWVEANPERVNDRDSVGYIALCTAVEQIQSLPLILWLVKEKGADVNAMDADGYTAIHFAESLEIINALLECGADPTLSEYAGLNMLMYHLGSRNFAVVERLLQDPRTHDIVNAKDGDFDTALHIASTDLYNPRVPAIIQLLLQAGADLTLTNVNDETPLDWMQRRHPSHPTTLALLEESLDAEKASFLIKVRRLVVAAARGNNAAAPIFVQDRLAHGQPLPAVALGPLTVGGENDEEDEDARRKLRTMLAFLVGMEGGGMSRDVFRVVLDLLLPFWHPLRRRTYRGVRSLGSVTLLLAITSSTTINSGSSSSSGSCSSSSYEEK